MDYYSLKRKELQDLCKKHHLPANVSNLKMADSLSALFKIEQVPGKVERKTVSSFKGSSDGSSGVGGGTKMTKTVRFLDQEEPNEEPVSKVTYQPQKVMSESGPRTRRRSILGTERSSSDGPEPEEPGEIAENREASRRITRSQAAKATDAMTEPEQAPDNEIGGDTKVAKTVRFLHQEKPNEVPIPEVTYQPEKMVSESGPRTRRKSLLCTKRSSLERPRSEETEAVPENHVRRITRSQAAMTEDTMAESEQAPVAEKERKTTTKKAKNEKGPDKAIHKMDEPCPTVGIVLSNEAKDEKNAGKEDDVEKIPPGIASKEPRVRSLRSRQVTITAKGNVCDASEEEALNEQQQNSDNRRISRKMMEKAREAQSDGRVLASEPHVHTKAKDAETKSLKRITCENALNSTCGAGLKVEEEFHPEYRGNKVRNTSARTRSQKKLRGATEEVCGENKENESILPGKPSRKSRRRAALKNELANFLEGDNLKSKIGNDLQQAANIDKATEQIKLCASQKQTHGSTDEAGKIQEDRVDHGNKILKRSRAPRQRKERIVRFKKDFERQGDLLTSDCEGDQEDNADREEAAVASGTHEILEAEATGVLLSSSNEASEMMSTDKELQKLGNNLQQNHNLEDLEIIEESTGLQTISTQWDYPDLKTTEDSVDRKKMKEDAELIEKPRTEIAPAHESTLTSSSDQEKDTSEVPDQHVTDVYLVDERLLHEKSDEHQSPLRKVNMQAEGYEGFEKEGSLVDKSVMASETTLTSPNGVEPVHEVLDEEKETPQSVLTVQDMLVSDGVPNESAGAQEISAVIFSENSADAELTGSKEIALNHVSSCTTPMSPAMEQRGLGDFMSNGCSPDEYKDDDEDTIPKSITRPRLQLGLGADSVAESKDKQDISSYSALMNKIVSSASGQNDNGKLITSLAITNIDLLNGKKVEDPNGTNEVDAKDIEDENESPSFTTETRYCGFPKDVFRETCQTEGKESREAFIPECGSDASPLIIAMLHTDPASQPRDEIVAPKSSCVVKMDSEAAEVPFLKKEKESKCLMRDLSSDKISIESPHVFRGATYGGGKIICGRCKDSSSEAVSESEPVTKADTAMIKKQREMATDRSGNESSLQNLEYPEDEKCSISYDLSQAISNESQCPENGCIIDTSAVPASYRIEKYSEATFSAEAFAEGYLNEYSNNHNASEVSNVKRTTCSSSDDEEIKAYDYFDVSCDNDGEANVNKSSDSLNYFEEVGNAGEKFSFCSSITEKERNFETTHEEFDQIHGDETFIHGDVSLPDFDDDTHSFEGSESDTGSKCTTQEHDAEQDDNQDSVKDDADICLTTLSKRQFRFHGFTSQHGISANTDILEDNQQTKSTTRKAADATEDVKSSLRKFSEDSPSSYERSNSIVKERFPVVDETARLILHETDIGESNHHFPAKEIFQDVPQIGEHKGCTETTDAAAEQKAELASCGELQKVVQGPQSAFKEPRPGNCAVEGVTEMDKFVFENCNRTDPEAEGAQDKNGTAESCSEYFNLEDAVVVHIPVTEYQNVQKFEEHKDHNEIMDVDANQKPTELLNQREQQEAEEISQNASKDIDHEHCTADMKQVNKFVLEENGRAELEGVHGKNGIVENCSEDLILENAVAIFTPVTKFYHHVQRLEETKVHSETMATDANQSMDELANQRDKNGTAESCSEDFNLEDAVVVHIPVTEYQNVQKFEEHKDHNEIVDVDANQKATELVNQREQQEAEERSQNASKDLDHEHCTADMKQVNILEEHDRAELEGVHGKNGIVENCSADLILEDAVAIFTPVTKFYHHVQRLEETKVHSETMATDANQSMDELANQRDKNGTAESCTEDFNLEDAVMVHIPVTEYQNVQKFEEHKDHNEIMDVDANQKATELVNQREQQEAEERSQNASKDLDHEHCTADMKQVNILEEHDRAELEGVHGKNGIVENCSADLILEDAVAIFTPVTKFYHHVQRLEETKVHSEIMATEANQSMDELANQRDKNGTAESCTEDFNLEDAVMVHIPVTEYQNVQKFEEHKDHNEIMDVDANQKATELVNQREQQEAEERSQNASKDLDHEHCTADMKQVNKFVLEEHDRGELEGVHGKNGIVAENCSEDLILEDAVAIFTPVTKFYHHVQRLEETKVHSETMATDANQSMDELANQRELQEATASTQSTSKELEFDQPAVDVKQVNTFVLEEHDPTELGDLLDKNGTAGSCLEVLSLEDAVAFQTPVIEFYHVEHKDQSETVDANEERLIVELADQKELQEVDEGTQGIPKELHGNHCSVDVRQANRFFLEDYNPTEPEGGQNQNKTVQSGTLTLDEEVKTMVHMPVEKDCQYVLEVKEDENCRETVDTGGDRQKEELVNQGELQSASEGPKLDYGPTKNVEEMNKLVLEEHNHIKSEESLERSEDVQSSPPGLSSEELVYAPVKETFKHVSQSGRRECSETMDADADKEKVELLNGEVLQAVEDNTQSSSDQLGLEGAQDKNETVEHISKETSLNDVQTEEHKDCKETIDPDSDRQKVELAHENQHQEGEEITQSSSKMPRLDARAIENFKEVIKFTVEENAKPDEARDRNVVVQSNSQSEDAMSFEEKDVKRTEDDQDEDGTKTSKLADVEEAEGITQSSPLTPRLEDARAIDEEHGEETNNSEGMDWGKIGESELTKDVIYESCEEKEQLSRTATTLLEGLVKTYFQDKSEKVDMGNDLKDKELEDGANRESGKANEASPQDTNVPDQAIGEIAEVTEKIENDEGGLSRYQPKSTEDGMENDELAHRKREENDSANSPSYLSKLNGKGNNEAAQIPPVEARSSTKSGRPPSWTEDVDDICNLMSTTLKISTSPTETSRNTGKGTSPMRSIDEEPPKGVKAVSSVPLPAQRETASQPSALSVVQEKPTIRKETLISPARRWKENTPSLTTRTKSTKVKEKTQASAARRRPLQAISGNNSDGFHSRLDFTR
ncbi:unnamed protein product [Victoria cruziana]